MAEPVTLLLVGTGFVGIGIARRKLPLAYRFAHESFRKFHGHLLSLVRNKFSGDICGMLHKPAAPIHWKAGSS